MNGDNLDHPDHLATWCWTIASLCFWASFVYAVAAGLGEIARYREGVDSEQGSRAELTEESKSEG